MAIRLASINNCKDFLKGGSAVASGSEQMTALGMILDGVSVAINNEILKSTGYSLLAGTSDGIQLPFEFYGNEHYGRGRRDTIRLKRGPVLAVSTVQDCNLTIDPANYVVDPIAAILWLRMGHFSDSPRAVKLIYTAGFAEIGSDDTRTLMVPEDLRNAALAQTAFEWTRREPGGAVFGATNVTRPDGSIVLEGSGLLKEVKEVIKRYAKGRGF